ncbi:hypothetical protein ACROYT_G037213 [Oculina patagonica]
MNKKARSTFIASEGTSVRAQHSTAAILLFTLWVICCGFVAGVDNASSISSADKSSIPVSTSVLPPATSVHSSHSVQVNSTSENVTSTSTTTPNSPLNKTSILTILQSSNFPIIGSTEPITLALSFVTTAAPETQSVARSVRSLLEASSLSIPGFTEPLTLALFTSALPSNSSVVEKLTPSLKMSKFETATSYISSIAGETDVTSSLPLRSIVVPISTTSFSALGSSISTDLNGSSSMQFSSKEPLSTTTFLSSIDLLQSTSNFLGAATSEITSSPQDSGTTTVSYLLPSVLSINSSYLSSYTSHIATDSPVSSTVFPLQNHTVSFSDPYSSGNLSASSSLQKALTSFTLTGSIIRTSFSAKKMTSDSQPTLTLSTVTMATSESDSASSQLVSTNVSRTLSFSRKTTALESSSAINSSIFTKMDSSHSFLSASSASDINHTHASSIHQGVSLATLAETASRTTNHSVSLHESSSYLHEKSSSVSKSSVEALPASQGTTVVTSFVNSTAASSSQPHPSSNVPVSTTPSLLLTTTSPFSSSPPQSRISLAATTVEISQSGVFSSALASVNVSSLTQNAAHISRDSSVGTTVNYLQQSTAISLHGFPSTLATDSSPERHRLTATLFSVHVSATSLLATSVSSGNASTASSQIQISTLSPLPRPSTTELAATSSVISVPPGDFVRFAIRVPLNESVNDASFKSNLEKGILVAYENGTLDGRTGNVSVNVVRIERLSAPDNTTVNVTFQVLNDGEPVLGFRVSQSVRQSNISLAQAIGYRVVLEPHAIMYLSTSSFIPTAPVTLLISTSLKSIGMTSVSSSAATTHSQQSMLLTQTSGVEIAASRSYTLAVSEDFSASPSSQSYLSSIVPVVTTSYKLQSTQEQSKLLTLTSEVTLSQNQSFATTMASANESAIPSTQVPPSSTVPVVTTSHMALSISPSSSVPEQSTISTHVPSVNTSRSQRLTETTASANVSGTSSFQVTVVTTSYIVLSTPLIPFTSTQNQSKPLVQTTSMDLSQSQKFTYIKVSAIPSSQFHPSSPVATTSYVAPSSSLTLSMTELVATSSVIFKSPGVYVRFAISVPLNDSVENASFKNTLEKGILAVYQNGTFGGMAENVSVNVVSIERSSSNATNVNVTFQVFNGSKPVLADEIIQSIERVEGSLAQAVGYEVVEKPHVVLFSTSSSLFTMLKTASVSAFETTSVTRASSERSVNATVSSTQQEIASSVPTDSPQSTLLTKTTPMETSPSRTYTIVVSVNESATPSSKMFISTEVTASAKSSPAIKSTASDQSVVVLTQISSLHETSKNRTFTVATIATTTVQSVEVSTIASSQMRSSFNVPQIISIKNSSELNDTMANVTVTFQVLNVTKSVPAYHVIQSIRRADITLEQALGYKVIQEPFIVYLSSTSSLSKMLRSSFLRSYSTSGSLSRTPQTFNSSAMIATISRSVLTVSSFAGNRSHFPSTAVTSSSGNANFPPSIMSSRGSTSNSTRLSVYASSTEMSNKTVFTAASLSLESKSSSQTPHLPSGSAARQNSTVSTISLSREMASSQATSNVSILSSTGATFRTPSPSYTSNQTVSLVTLNSTASASRASVLITSSGTKNASKTTSVVFLNYTMLTSTQGSTASSSMIVNVTSFNLSAASMSSRTVSASAASVLSSLLSNVTSTAVFLPSRSLSLNASLHSQSVVAQNSSFGTSMLATTSKHAISSRTSVVLPSTSTSSHSQKSRNATMSLGHSATMLTQQFHCYKSIDSNH